MGAKDNTLSELLWDSVVCVVMSVVFIIVYLLSGIGLMLFMAGFLSGLAVMGIVACLALRRRTVFVTHTTSPNLSRDEVQEIAHDETIKILRNCLYK